MCPPGASSLLPKTAGDVCDEHAPEPVVGIMRVLEQRLDSSERVFRSLIENIPQVVFTVVNERPEFVSVNVERVCGFSQAEVLDASDNVWLSRIHGDDSIRVGRLLAGLSATDPVAEAEYRWQHKDGSWLWLRGRFRLRSGAGRDILGILTDTSAEKRMRDELLQLQKIAAIGQCTAGIAHDFNNLLGVILASATFLNDGLSDADPRRGDAEAILDAAERAVALVKRLLTFSRRRTFEPKVFDVNVTVTEAQALFHRVIGKTIEFELALHSEPCLVLADPNEIEQVLVNLVVNARDAMPDGGKLSIATSPVEFNARHRTDTVPLLTGGYVLLTVTDTGCGIDAATRPRIFEPFFTTKSQGQGTGLGLSTCHTIVTEVGGHIWVDSEPGAGSQFTVCLPRVETTAVAAPGATAATTILVIEDDDRLRDVVERSLRRQRHCVLVARDEAEAIAVAEAHTGPVHLIISDVVLADRSGPDVVAAVRSRVEVAKALFMSGHTHAGLVQQGLLPTDANFIQKPFVPDALAQAVRDVLRADSGR